MAQTLLAPNDVRLKQLIGDGRDLIGHSTHCFDAATETLICAIGTSVQFYSFLSSMGKLSRSKLSRNSIRTAELHDVRGEKLGARYDCCSDPTCCGARRFLRDVIAQNSKHTLVARLAFARQGAVFDVVRLAIDTALLFAGHLALRERAVSSRLAYALMGGVMAASSYALVLRNGLLLAPPDSGSEITGLLVADICGNDGRVLYCQFAGLAPAKAWPRFSIEGLRASFTFDGPVRVRTSVAATAVAAVIPANLDRGSVVYICVDVSAAPADAGGRRVDLFRCASRARFSSRP